MVILKLLEFLLIAFLTILPIACIVKSGMVDNRPGNIISCILVFLSKCFTSCKCRQNRGVDADIV